MTTTRSYFRSGFRSGLVAMCGMVLLMMLIGAAKVDAEAPAVQVAMAVDVAAMNLGPTADLQRADVVTPRTDAEPDVNDKPSNHDEAISAGHKIRVLWMEVTAYCPCTECCGPGAMGLTASGKHVSYNNGAFVAADTDVLPFGTKLMIPGYSDAHPIEVIDRGGAIKGHKLDVFFDSHEQALEWGRQWVAVTVVE